MCSEEKRTDCSGAEDKGKMNGVNEFMAMFEKVKDCCGSGHNMSACLQNLNGMMGGCCGKGSESASEKDCCV